MWTTHTILILAAAVCFVIAAKPPAGVAVRFEWLAAALVALAFVF